MSKSELTPFRFFVLLFVGFSLGVSVTMLVVINLLKGA